MLELIETLRYRIAPSLPPKERAEVLASAEAIELLEARNKELTDRIKQLRGR